MSSKGGCASCRGPSDGYVRDRCAPCARYERLDALLSGTNGDIRPELRGIHEALSHWRNPRSVLTLLDRSDGASLLAELAKKACEISHADLDGYPRSRFSNHLRHALVHTGAPPRRDEPIEQVEAWLDDFLSKQTTAHTQVLRSR